MDNWKESNIKMLGTVFTNNTFSRDCLNYDSGEYQNIHYGDVLITFSDIIDANSPLVPYINSNETIKSDTLIEDGDIIVADTAEDETVGKICEIQNVGKRKIVSGLHTLWYRPNKNEFAPKYLGYLLNTFECHKQLVRKAHGIKVLSINKGDFWKTIIKYPASLEEQNAIAGIISKVDQCIENAQKTIDATQKLKKSLMQNLLTGRMKPDGSMRTDGDFYEHPKMGKVPIGWEVKKLKDIGKVITGKTPPTEKTDVFAINNNGYMFITPGDLGKTQYLHTTERFVTEKGLSYSYELPKDAICVVCIGSTIGKIGITTEKGCTNQQINSIICNENIDNFFIYYILSFNASKLKSIAGINATPQLNKGDFSQFKIIIPTDIDEQIAICKILNKLTNKIDISNRKIEHLKKLKKSLIQNFLTGKKRVDVEKINTILESMK